MLQKKILRKKVLKQRQALTMDEAKNFSTQIVQYLIKTISWHRFSVVHLYLSCDQRKEINTQPLLEYLWAEQKHIVTVTNRMEQNPIKCYTITPDTPLEKNAIGILEPAVNAKKVDSSKIDLMILPLLACDEKGFRLGYGKGFYDRLLVNCSRAHRVGVNYFEPLAEHIPREPHDEPLHQLVTPFLRFDFQ